MYAKDFAQVGTNIQRCLEKKGMTQQSLADALGVSKQVMSKIIKGNKAINVNELSSISSVLNVSPNVLLAAQDKHANPDVLSFMGSIKDEDTRGKIELLRSAIDEIQMLEDLLDE